MNLFHRGIEVGEAQVFDKITGKHVSSISSRGGEFHGYPTMCFSLLNSVMSSSRSCGRESQTCR